MKVVITGATGLGSIVRLKSGDTVPEPQGLVPVTVIIPETALSSKSTVMFAVLAPEAIVAPEGNVQSYPVALAIGATENATPIDPVQTNVGPVIVPASPGKFNTVTGKFGDEVPFPQRLLPYTVIFPEEALAEKSTVIEFVY